MSGEDLAREKSVLRLKGRAARRAVLSEQRLASAEAIAWRVLELPESQDIRAALLYGATPEEASPHALERRLRARGVRIAYPRVADARKLTLHWVDDPGMLVEAAFGLLEPQADAPRAMPSEIDLVIVPGIAFDADGNRLGFGGGYYDVLLADPELQAPSVAIAYDEQIVESVPHDERDRSVDVVVTPTSTLRPATTRS